MFKKILIIAIVLICIAVISYSMLTALFPMNYSELVEQYASEYGVKTELVYAVIKAESNFEPDAASYKGAVGLMQITPETGEWCAGKMKLEYKDLSDADTNINIGVWYLSYLIDKTDSEDLAVMSYNAGIGKVNTWIKDGIVKPSELNTEDIPYGETRKYLKKVQIFTKIYRALYDL